MEKMIFKIAVYSGHENYLLKFVVFLQVGLVNKQQVVNKNEKVS